MLCSDKMFAILRKCYLQIDMVQIKQCFLSITNQTLWSWLNSDCSGDYKKLLQGIVGRG